MFEGCCILDMRIKKFIYYTFFILQLLTIIALIGSNKFDNEIKFNYIRDILFLIAIVSVYILIENKHSICVSNYIRGCVLLLLLLHTYAGKYWELYITLSTFDKMIHVFGIYSLSIFIYSIMSQFTPMSFASKLNKFIFITVLGFSLGAVFEIIEYIGDITINPKMHNQSDLTDTNLDLVADLVGTLIAAFHVCFTNIESRMLKFKR